MHTHTHKHTPLETYAAFPGMLSAAKQGNNSYSQSVFMWFFFYSPSRSVSLSLFLALSSFNCVSAPFITPFVVQYIQYINKYSCCVSSSLWLVLSTAPQPARTQEKQRNMPLTPSGQAFLETLYCLWGGVSCYYLFLLGFMLCFCIEIINYPACKWEQFTVRQ